MTSSKILIKSSLHKLKEIIYSSIFQKKRFTKKFAHNINSKFNKFYKNLVSEIEGIN